jgi:hypothetical protein
MLNPMAVVDPDDDSIDRYVVWHYRYDAVRNERRNVVAAAFDDEQEFLAQIKRRVGQLDELQARGEADEREHIGGVWKPAGEATEQPRRRTKWKVHRFKKARVRKRRREER